MFLIVDEHPREKKGVFGGHFHQILKMKKS